MRADTDRQILPHPGFGYFDRFGNGKVNNSIPVKPFGLKMKTFYIRGYCGAAWMGLDPSKFAIWRDRGVPKMGPRPASLGWNLEKVDFENVSRREKN